MWKGENDLAPMFFCGLILLIREVLLFYRLSSRLTMSRYSCKSE